MQCNGVAADFRHRGGLHDHPRCGTERYAALRGADGIRCCFGVRSCLLEHDSIAGLIDNVATDGAADVWPENDPGTIYGVNAVALDGERRGETGTILAIESGSMARRSCLPCCG